MNPVRDTALSAAAGGIIALGQSLSLRGNAPNMIGDPYQQMLKEIAPEVTAQKL
jgi:hypothetical protein